LHRYWPSTAIPTPSDFPTFRNPSSHRSRPAWPGPELAAKRPEHFTDIGNQVCAGRPNYLTFNTMIDQKGKTVITDLTIRMCSSPDNPQCHLEPQKWHCIKKDLFLNTSEQNKGWINMIQKNESDININDLVVIDIRVGEPPQASTHSGLLWESRPCDLWILRSNYSDEIGRVVTGVDVLFGVDAVDPRLQWELMREPLQLGAGPEVPYSETKHPIW
jgi:hypothetical protein